MGVVVGEVNATVQPGPEREAGGDLEAEEAAGAGTGLSPEDLEAALQIRSERRARLIAD